MVLAARATHSISGAFKRCVHIVREGMVTGPVTGRRASGGGCRLLQWRQSVRVEGRVSVERETERGDFVGN